MSVFSINLMQLENPVPETLLVPPSNAAKPMLPFNSTFSEMDNGLSEGSMAKWQDHISVNWGAIGAASGNRVELDNTSNFATWPDGIMDGGTYEIRRITNGVMSHVLTGTIQRWHANTPDAFNVMTSDKGSGVNGTVRRFTANTADITYASTYKPNGQYWIGVCHLNAAGDQSEYTYSGPVIAPSSPSTIVVTNVYSDDAITGVVDNTIPQPTGLTVAAQVGNESVVDVNVDAFPVGVTGMLVHRFDTDPTVEQLDNLVELEAGHAAQTQVGDLIIFHKSFSPNATRDEFQTNRIWGGPFLKVSEFHRLGSTPFVGEADAQYLPDGLSDRKMVLTMQPNAEREILRVILGRLAGNFYDSMVTGQIGKVRVKMRRVYGNGTVTLGIDRSVMATQTLALTDAVQTFEYTFTPNAETDDAVITNCELNFKTIDQATQFEVFDFVVWDATDGEDPMDIRQTDRDFLTDLNLNALRDHDSTQTRPNGPDMHDLTDRYGALALNLKNMAGLSPVFWPQIPPWLPEDQQLGLIEFLCAPYDPAVDTPETKPWAAKRYNNGQHAPWTDVYDFWPQNGNEAWNPRSEFWVMPEVSGHTTAESAAALDEWIISVWRSSPYWIEDKFKLIIGGRNGTDWAQVTTESTPSGAFVTYNLYNGRLWEDFPGQVGEGFTYSDAYVYGVLQSATTRWEVMMDELYEWLDPLNAQRALDGLPEIIPMSYEDNQTSDRLPSPDTTQQDLDDQQAAWWSNALQTAFVDQSMAVSARGWGGGTFLGLKGGGGQFFQGKAPSSRGGAVTSAMQFRGLMNREFLPGTVTKIGGPRIVAHPVIGQNGAPIPDAGQLGAYLVEGQGKKAIVLTSLRIPGQGMDADTGDGPGDGVTEVKIKAPGDFTSARIYTCGGIYSDHNSTLATKDDLNLELSDVAVLDGFVTYDLQPGKWALIEFL